MNKMISSLNEIQLKNDTERLIILRKRLGISQFQFAKEIGVSSSYLGQIERDDVPLTKQIRSKINAFLKQEKEMYEKNTNYTF